jgi:hypothetical protein
LIDRHMIPLALRASSCSASSIFTIPIFTFQPHRRYGPYMFHMLAVNIDEEADCNRSQTPGLPRPHAQQPRTAAHPTQYL